MSLADYKEQLKQIEEAIISASNNEEKQKYLSLKTDLEEIISLLNTEGGYADDDDTGDPQQSDIDNEYAQFMNEISEIDDKPDGGDREENSDSLLQSLKDLEGKKCRAPHKHTWGDVVYHNAMICSIEPDDSTSEVLVRVMYTNPTHREMLPCPYFLEGECKFTVEMCRFSHGELVDFHLIRDYDDPDFGQMRIGSTVLAKRAADKLWHRATVRRLPQSEEESCVLRFDSNGKEDVLVPLAEVLPLHESDNKAQSSDGSDCDEQTEEDVINMSLMVTPSSQNLGHWEKHTRGIGSKLMQRMGYIIGTGLGKRAEGIIDPVSAVVLPKGKSLDHCMVLREQAGNDRDLFSAERMLKRQQRREEKRSARLYDRERERAKHDVFGVINAVMAEDPANSSSSDLLGAGSSSGTTTTSTHRRSIKQQSCRNLNVESLKIDESIKVAYRNLARLDETLQRRQSADEHAVTALKGLQSKRSQLMDEITRLKAMAVNIKNEQNVRSDNKKLTIF